MNEWFKENLLHFTSGRQPLGPHGPLNSQFWIPRTTNMNFF
jgi:hypothetical protein